MTKEWDGAADRARLQCENINGRGGGPSDAAKVEFGNMAVGRGQAAVGLKVQCGSVNGGRRGPDDGARNIAAGRERAVVGRKWRGETSPCRNIEAVRLRFQSGKRKPPEFMTFSDRVTGCPF